jgi:cytochrome c553
MIRPNRMSLTVGIAVVAVVAVIAGLSYVRTRAAAPPASAEPKAPAALVEFTDDGKLKQPVGYRKWVYVGTPLTPNDLNGGEASFPEFHEVYMDPESFAHYEKTGKFRDGTVLVKELSSVGSKEAPSGKGYFQGEFTGLEVAIKDSKRFKDEPGNWAYFSFGHKYPLKEQVAKNAVASCNQCHQDNAKKTDWVYSQYYPVLRAAAPKSK